MGGSVVQKKKSNGRFYDAISKNGYKYVTLKKDT